MPFDSGLVRNVFFLRWIHPECGDSARLLELVAKARERVGSPLVYVAIVPSQQEAPDNETRRELTSGLKDLLEHCECVHLVIEGSGFSAATKRAAAAGIFLVTGRRGRVSPHPTVIDALGHCPHLGASPDVILDEAMVRGLAPKPVAKPPKPARRSFMGR